ncbi:bifunctional enoyl-CoA hydratase/phosphate acetyltransferase [Legionella impletisoli]|uniref:Phosphate acetyltransferase n=1 Tax=Legionella impletisoli TaxID=343510 RepID=A0A917N8W5_9GAMM|nr:bifunctional enoyl-CoA hydratase/phosphate acetyltransferase [Legionella impletisoli]GGI78021.1 phosphate acetyltransferase [Legionella impletisoli]
MSHNSELEIPFYERLLEDSKGIVHSLKTAIVHPVEKNSIEGAIAAAKENLIEPVFVGPEDKILKAAEDASLDISNFELIATKHSHEAAETAVRMASKGEVDALMKGHIHTDELLSFVVSKDSGLRTARRISHVFCMDIPREIYPKPLWLSDAAINIKPTLEDKKDIIQNAIDLFRACGFGTPKVAILSATEKITHKIPSTVEAAALCKMAERDWITGGVLDGPLAFDNAISKEAAEIKQIKSNVAGDVDILIVPDIESGNMLYKQMKYLSGYNAAGIVMGAHVPIMLTSRVGGVKARLASAALALLYVNGKETREL